jgi:hypothetical protein
VTGESGSTTTPLQEGLAKVIIYYDTTNAVNRQSINVSGVTDNGVGNSTISYTNAMVGNAISSYVSGDNYYGIGEIFGSGSSSHFQRVRGDSAYTTLVDTTATHAAVFGDLA